MKKKIILIISIVIFILILIFLNSILNKQMDITIKDNLNDEVEENNMVINVNNDSFESEVLKSEKLVLIDFYATWCMPCKMLSPIVEEISTENTSIKVVKIDVDDNQEIAEKYGIVSIPTLIAIKDGEEVNRIVGLVSKSEIENILK